MKLILDMISKGTLNLKSTSFKSLPQSLSEIYHLTFSLLFPTAQSFELISQILSIALAVLQPVSLDKLFHIFSALYIKQEVAWNEFQDRYRIIADFLVTRSDGTLMFFHPTLREWLLARREGESTKFLCDPKLGHAAIAYFISRETGKLRKPESVLDLIHHLLKANLNKITDTDSPCSNKDLQAAFLSLSTDDVSAPLGSTRNIFSPILKVSRLLLLAGADPNTRTELEQAAPLVAAHSKLGHTDMVSLLLEFGADPNLADDVGLTALSQASAGGHLHTVQLLLQCGASLGQTELLSAVRGGHQLVVELFLEQCQLSPALLRQALSEAILHGQESLVERLLDLPVLRLEVSPEEESEETWPSPLEAAVRKGQVGLVRDLVRRGVTSGASSVAGLASVSLAAAEQGDLPVLECLLAGGAGVEGRDEQGRTALMVASAGGHTALLEPLIRAGAGLEDSDREGLTPLTHAVLSGQQDTVSWLVARGGNVNRLDCYHRSPLDVAIYQAQPAMVELLLDAGADMERPDMKGIKPLDRSIGHGNTEILSVFLRKGAKLGAATWAMARGREDIQLILLNKLLEDGNTLYRQQRLLEASHRYRYALKRLASIQPAGELKETFGQLETNLLLNLSRAERRRGNNRAALQLSSRVLQSEPQSVQVSSPASTIVNITLSSPGSLYQS